MCVGFEIIGLMGYCMFLLELCFKIDFVESCFVLFFRRN